MKAISFRTRSCQWARILGITCAFLLLFVASAFAEQLHFIYTSDQHYGITRQQFRSQQDVSATIVNAAMVQAINSLPDVAFPADNGVRAGQKVGWADYVISTGDIANRMEGTDPAKVPTASACWAVYEQQYINGISLKDRHGIAPEVLAIPGNHDATNAVGFYRPMTPTVDNGAMLAMYNRSSNTPIRAGQFNYDQHKVYLSRDLGGVRLLLVQMWPDSAARAWLAKEISALPQDTPVLLLTHDQPDIESKHLINPNGDHSINSQDKFENLVTDMASSPDVKAPALSEMRALADFLRANPTIVAYFHGNENENEFYNWKGPDNNISMPTFRVDSPMKGNVSSKDETMLSFQSVSIDTDTRQMTVREVFWNANPSAPGITWGSSRSISMR